MSKRAHSSRKSESNRKKPGVDQLAKKRQLDLLDPSHVWEDEHRTVYLVGNIDEETIRETVEKVVTLSERSPQKPITLIINTAGGDVDDTFMLYDLMKFIKTPIHTVGLGRIMSAGCLLLAAGEKGQRRMGKNARIMYHAGWDFFGGSIFEAEASLAAFKAQEAQYDARFAEETGMSIEAVEALYNKNGPTADHYLTADEALKLGIVDILI